MTAGTQPNQIFPRMVNWSTETFDSNSHKKEILLSRHGELCITKPLPRSGLTAFILFWSPMNFWSGGDAKTLLILTLTFFLFVKLFQFFGSVFVLFRKPHYVCHWISNYTERHFVYLQNGYSFNTYELLPLQISCLKHHTLLFLLS